MTAQFLIVCFCWYGKRPKKNRIGLIWSIFTQQDRQRDRLLRPNIQLNWTLVKPLSRSNPVLFSGNTRRHSNNRIGGENRATHFIRRPNAGCWHCLHRTWEDFYPKLWNISCNGFQKQSEQLTSTNFLIRIDPEAIRMTLSLAGKLCITASLNTAVNAYYQYYKNKTIWNLSNPQ
jgi:hypothetical protein